MGKVRDYKTLLAQESCFPIDPAILDEMLDNGESVVLKTYEPLIDTGKYDPNIYIVKSGLIRGTYLDKNIERTAGFALAGTLFMSFHCYYADQPSYYRFEACCASEVIRVPRSYFNNLIATNHQFAQWILSAHQNQLFYNEFKSKLMTGSARERLMQLTENLGILLDQDAPDAYWTRLKEEVDFRWREISRFVPAKIIASYLGITEQHLSKIKKEILSEYKKNSHK